MTALLRWGHTGSPTEGLGEARNLSKSSVGADLLRILGVSAEQKSTEVFMEATGV